MVVRSTLLASLVAVASSTVQVAQPGYWDEVYAESLRMNVTDFHSYWQDVNFEKLAQVLGDRLQLREDLIVLVLGSGDSSLPEEIHQKGVAEVIAMDLSPRLQGRARLPGVRSLMEDARSQTSLEASSVDVIIELGLLDVILAEADVEGAAALLREARRLLCAGGLFISGSTDIPKFRQPLLAEHPAGGWAEAEVLRLDRPRALDRRVKELDPSWEVDRIFIYLNLAAGEVEVGQANRPARTEAATAAPPPTTEVAAPSPEAAVPPAAQVEAAAPSQETAAPPAAPVAPPPSEAAAPPAAPEAAAPSPEPAAPPAATVAAPPSPEAAAPPAEPVAAAPSAEAAAPPAIPVEAAAPSPEAAAPPAVPVEAAAPSPEPAAPPAEPVEAAAPSPEAAAPPAPPSPEAAAPPAEPVAAAPSPEAAAPPAAPEAAAPSPEPAAPPAALEAVAPASSSKSPAEDPAAAFAESIKRLQAQAAALAKS